MLRVHVVGREVISLLGSRRITPLVNAVTKKSMTAFVRVSAAALPRMMAKREPPRARSAPLSLKINIRPAPRLRPRPVQGSHANKSTSEGEG